MNILYRNFREKDKISHPKGTTGVTQKYGKNDNVSMPMPLTHFTSRFFEDNFF